MEIRRYTKHLDALDNMKRYPKDIFYVGNIELLDRPKVSIVGSRRPFGYVKEFTQKIAITLAKRGVITRLGGKVAMGWFDANLAQLWGLAWEGLDYYQLFRLKGWPKLGT